MAWKAQPELFYVLELWSGFAQSEWKSLTPEERLHLLTSEYRWVVDEMPVLPLAVEVQHSQPKQPQLDETYPPITIYFSPQAHVGFTEDMQGLGQKLYRRATEKDANQDWQRRAVFKAPAMAWPQFGQWSVSGGGGVIDALERFYRHGEDDHPECLAAYGVLVTRMHKAAQKAADRANDEEDEEDVEEEGAWKAGRVTSTLVWWRPR